VLLEVLDILTDQAFALGMQSELVDEPGEPFRGTGGNIGKWDGHHGSSFKKGVTWAARGGPLYP
jgi:hypothetical protein